jgi:predicted nucleic acid-binding protein
VDNAILVDTDILIEAGRGTAEALDCLQEHEEKATLTISVITQMELLVGCRDKRELEKLTKFLKRFQVLHLDEVASRFAADLIKKYRLSHGLLIPDALIAASAMASGLPLLTRNMRDYRFITGLTLLPYP